MEVPRGRQGSWFAEWEGELLPCVHQHWTQGHWPHYLDPNADGRPEWPAFIDAIRGGGKVILTTSHPPDENGKWRRKSYVSIWRVSDVTASDGKLEFDFVEQLHRF